MITLRFVGYNDFTSGLIRIGEGGGWTTHVETVMPDGKYLGAVGGFNIPGGSGVQERDPGYDASTMSKELFVKLITVDDEIDNTYYDFLRAQIGKPYDYLGIGSLVFRSRDWRKGTRWFCSELVAAGLEKAGYFPRLYTVTNHLSPRDLLLVISGKEVVNDIGHS